METGKYYAIDFLLTSQKSFLQLKELIRGHKLGKILSVTGVAPAIRDINYFNRNQWAGKLTLETRNFVLASNGAFESSVKVHYIPDEYKIQV